MRRFARILSAIIAACICTAALTFDIKTNAATNVTLEDMMAEFPDGKYWNHMGMYDNNADGWTDQPCEHVLFYNELGDYYYYVGMGSCNYYGGECQCVGFVYRLLSELYGVSDCLSWERREYLGDLKAGDVVRFKYNMHTAIVTGVYGDCIVYGDCNANFDDCRISWYNRVSRSDLEETLTYVYSAPEELTVKNGLSTLINQAGISNGFIDKTDSYILIHEYLNTHGLDKGNPGYELAMSVLFGLPEFLN